MDYEEGNEKMIRSIEASKYIQMPVSKLRRVNNIEKYNNRVKPVSKSERTKEYRNAFRKSK